MTSDSGIFNAYFYCIIILRYRNSYLAILASVFEQKSVRWIAVNI